MKKKSGTNHIRWLPIYAHILCNKDKAIWQSCFISFDKCYDVDFMLTSASRKEMKSSDIINVTCPYRCSVREIMYIDASFNIVS